MTIAQKNVIDTMLKPKSFAVIGASNREGSLGWQVMKKVTSFGYTGKIYPINPKAPDIMGIKAYPLASEVPGPIDTAVVCVPGKFVIPVVQDLHKKGVTSCVIISAGFKEIGPVGVEREKKLKEIIKETGMRVIGPNCFGIINATEEISLDCTFARYPCSRGRIGFVSQSGAMGAAVNEDLRHTTMGISTFISLGNRIDFDENEALEYLARDEHTDIIFMYLENFADPVKFMETAGKITPHKPILALKAGRSSRGAIAAASHTGQMAQSDKMVDALMEKAGVVRVFSVDELIDTAKAMYSGVIPEKEDLAIVTNAGGFGVLSVDRAEELGVKLADLTKETREYLQEHLPPEASCKNPVDLLGTATDEQYGIALKGLLKDPNVGAVIYNFGPPVMQKADPIAQRAVDIAKRYPDKPVLSIYMNRRRIMEPLKDAEGVYVSQFDYPEDAIHAYSHLLEYKSIRSREKGVVPGFNVDRAKVDNIIKKAQVQGKNQLDFNEAEEVLNAYGVPTAKSALIVPGDDIKEKTAHLKYPVAIKPAWGGVVHKTEMNAVRLGLAAADQVHTAVNEVCTSISNSIGRHYDKGFIVQEMAADRQEVILGAVRQDSGIHLLMFGLGGIFTELMKDVAFAIPPITGKDALRMVKKTKGSRLLEGFRGRPGYSINDVTDALCRLSMLVTNHRQIKELDVNPFMAGREDGESMAVDVRIIL